MTLPDHPSPPTASGPQHVGKIRENSLETEILQCITDGCLVTDSEGRLTFINAVAHNVFVSQGTDPNALLGKRLFDDAVPEARPTSAAAAYERTLTERVPTTVNHFYEPWQRWHYVRHFPTSDGGVVTFFQDVTDRNLLVSANDTFRLLVENAPFGLYAVDADFRLLQISRGAQKVFENVRPLLGRDFAEVLRQIWEEPFASQAIDRFRHTLATGESYHSARTIERRHDIEEVEAYDWKLERVTLPDGRFGVVCHFYDLSERQAAEARATFLNRLSQKLANVKDAYEINRIATREAGLFFGVHRCYFFDVAEDARQITVMPDWRRSGQDLAGTYRTGDFGMQEWWHMAAIRPLGIDDVHTHPWTRDFAANYPSLDVRAYALAPFVLEGRWVASVGISSDTARVWTQEELELLENIVARVWPLIERGRSEAALRESETRLQRALDASEMGTFIWYVHEDHAEPDLRFLALFGLTEEESINHKTALTKLVHRDDVERYSEAVARAVHPGGSGILRVEVRIVLRDRSIRWLAITGQTHFEGQPRQAIYMAGAAVNITERKQAEEELKFSEARLRAFVTASSDSLYRMNADWSVMNQLDGRNFIADTSAANRHWLQQYIHPEDQGVVIQAFQEAIRSKSPFQLEHRVIRADGALGWIFSRAVPILGPKGKILEWFGTASDVTERKAAELALRESEARFRHMANNAPVMVWITEADGTCTFLSESWYEFTGQTPATGLGFGWIAATHPDDQEAVHAAFVAANEKKGPFRAEYRVRRRDGEYRWALDASTPRFDADGNYLGYIGSVIDITERKLAEEALRASDLRKTALIELNDRLREVKEPADLAYSAAELLGRTLNVSRCGYGTVDLAAETITIEKDWNAPGIKTIAGVLHFRDYGSYIEDLKRGETAIVSDAETDPRTASTAQALKAISAQAFINHPVTEEGGFVALLYLNHAQAREWPEEDLAFVHEVAERTRIAVERRRTEQALRVSMDEAALGHERAKVASRAKDDFLAALSHELRTPLNPVLLVASELANDRSLPTEARSQLRMIQRNIGLEARLIDDLLDLTRISRGMLQIQPETVDTHSLLRHTEEILRADLAGRRLDFQLYLGARQSFVRADPARLQQIFWNLLKNSVKFTPDGGRITVRTSDAEDDTLRIEVADTGRGIPIEALERIFSPFDQGDLSGRHAFGGLGLGLSISKALLDLHGGTLRATSPGQDQGAIFTVELSSIAAPQSETRRISVAPVTSPRLRLLVVEDDATTLNVLVTLLRRRGHDVSPASTVASALALASSQEFDLVISDLGLPDGTGQDIMREVKKNHGWPGIALSGFGMESDLQESRAAGFTAHLVKPVAVNDLLRVIASMKLSAKPAAPAPSRDGD